MLLLQVHVHPLQGTVREESSPDRPHTPPRETQFPAPARPCAASHTICNTPCETPATLAAATAAPLRIAANPAPTPASLPAPYATLQPSAGRPSCSRTRSLRCARKRRVAAYRCEHVRPTDSTIRSRLLLPAPLRVGSVVCDGTRCRGGVCGSLQTHNTPPFGAWSGVVRVRGGGI